MKYKDYELEHFLMDEFFIQWVKCPEGSNSHFWEKWLLEHPEKRPIVMEAAQIIRGVRYGHRFTLTDKIYVETFENIFRSTSSKEPKASGVREKNHHLFLLSIKKFAAIIILGFCFWMAYSAMFQHKTGEEMEREVPLITKSNPSGVKTLITLADGSRVYLNAGSSLQYPRNFRFRIREVQLTGEAFFDIQQETDRPFVVNSGAARIKVLGTSFNVNQDGSGKIAVALVSGKVQVNDDKGNQVNLEPSEMLVMNKSGEFYKSGFDPLEILGWKDRKLVFKKDSFISAQRKIENWYGVEVLVKGPMPQGWVYTGVYEDETLENVLEGIFYTSGITYKLEGKKVTIFIAK